MFDWPQDAAAIRRYVEVDFAVDRAIVASQSVAEFDAVRPIGPSFSYKQYGLVEQLQTTIRDSAPPMPND
jgi:hypothetical protein